MAAMRSPVLLSASLLLIKAVLAITKAQSTTATAEYGHSEEFIDLQKASIEFGSLDINITFEQDEISKILQGQTHLLHFNLTGTFPPGSVLRVISSEIRTLVIEENATTVIPDTCSLGCVLSTSVVLKGVRLGRATLSFVLTRPEDEDDVPQSPWVLHEGFPVAVMRPRGLAVKIYILITVILLVLIVFGFGCQLNMDILVQIIKKPIPPAIGFCCQFGIMPLLGFGISYVLKLPSAFGFGLLTYSCSPGGGMSNVWASILGGDLTLSMLMTFLSTTLSLGMMPLWMFLLGRFFVESDRVFIPYFDIAKSLLLLVIPCLLGILLNRFKPNIGRFVARASKYFSITFLLYQLFVCAWVNSYMYEVMVAYPIVFAAALLLPWCAFIAGFGIALLFHQPRSYAITIALETGIQNAGVPITMLLYAFPQPEGDLGAVLPMAAAYMTTIPLHVYNVGRLIRNRFCKSAQEEKTKDSEKDIEGLGKCPSELPPDMEVEAVPVIYVESVCPSLKPTVVTEDDAYMYKKPLVESGEEISSLDSPADVDHIAL